MDEDRFYSELGKKISDLRVLKGEKQELLADYLGLSRSSITNIEKGRQKPSLFVILGISKYFDIKIDDLIPHSDDSSVLSKNGRVIGQDFDLDFINKNKSLSDFLERNK